MAKKYEYNGTVCTLTELIQFSSVSQKTLSKRLANGWDVKQAVETPTTIGTYARQTEKQEEIQIIFSAPVPNVFAQMQPVIGKIYTAKVHICNRRAQMCKYFYTINLAPGRPLIVYDGEFKIINPAAAKAA